MQAREPRVPLVKVLETMTAMMRFLAAYYPGHRGHVDAVLGYCASAIASSSGSGNTNTGAAGRLDEDNVSLVVRLLSEAQVCKPFFHCSRLL